MLIKMVNKETGKEMSLETSSFKTLEKTFEWLDDGNGIDAPDYSFEVAGAPFSSSIGVKLPEGLSVEYPSIRRCKLTPSPRKVEDFWANRAIKNDAANKSEIPGTLTNFLAALKAIGEINEEK